MAHIRKARSLPGCISLPISDLVKLLQEISSYKVYHTQVPEGIIFSLER